MDNIFLEGEVSYDEKYLLKTNTSLMKQALLPFVISAVICLLAIVFISVSNVNKLFVLIPICLIIFLIILVVSYFLRIKTAVKESLTTKPNSKLIYRFSYSDFSGELISDTSKFSFEKKYDEIKKMLTDKDNIYIFFYDVVIALEKKNISPHQEAILKTLIKSNKISITKDGIYYSLIALFTLSLLTPFIGIILISLMVAASSIPEFPYLTLKFIYVFFFLLIIPALSIVLGVALRKRYRCKKNIIGGIIMFIITFIFASMSFSPEAAIKTDFKYVDEVSEIVHLDFPDEGYCDYLVVDGKGNFQMMVRFSDQSEVMKVINSSSFTKQLEPTIYMNLPVSYQLTIKDYDYYLIYDADNRLYNESIEGESYVLCYKETTNLLYCFSLNR